MNLLVRSAPNSKTGGATSCQFASDLRRQQFEHEKPSDWKSEGFSLVLLQPFGTKFGTKYFFTFR